MRCASSPWMVLALLRDGHRPIQCWILTTTYKNKNQGRPVPIGGLTPEALFRRSGFSIKGIRALSLIYKENNLKRSDLRSEGAWMMEHRVVVHFRDGEIVKGRTFHFTPTKDSFHVTTLDDHRQMVTVFTPPSSPYSLSKLSGATRITKLMNSSPWRTLGAMTPA
jgi:hypothetical protein